MLNDASSTDAALDAQPGPSVPWAAAVDLQDDLLTATHDLDRLQALLAHACDELSLGFHGAMSRLQTAAANDSCAAVSTDASQVLLSAVTALQFQDMASQLIAHTQQRLRNCADRLARETMGDDEDGTAIVEDGPRRPNPVTQDEMDAGSVELF